MPQLKILQRYIRVTILILIAFVVVRLKIFKVFCTSLNGSFLFFGGPLLLQIWSNFAKIFTTCSIKIKNKQLFKNLVKVQIFAGTGRTQSLFFLSNFGPPFSHEDGRNKKKILIGKTVVIRLSKALSTLPFLGKI